MLKRRLSILAALLFAAPWALNAQTLKNNDAGLAVPGVSIKTISEVPSCPSVFGTLGSGSFDLPGVSGTHSPRIFRNGVASSCAVPKAWPGTFGAGNYAYDAYTLTNPNAGPVCVNMNVYAYIGDVSSQVHLTVYSGSFNPANISANYLADSGSSALPGGSTGLSFTVGAFQTIVVVLTNPGGTGTGEQYLLSYNALCVFYTNAYLDDLGRSQLCINRFTGQYRWTVLTGMGAGSTYLGIANVSNGGNTLVSSPMDPLKFVFNYYVSSDSALGFFHPASWGNQVGSILTDRIVSDDPPSDCIRIPDAAPH